MDITVREAAAAVGGRILTGNGETRLRHISLNSRQMQGNDLFVPIIGEKVDAHRFIAGAFEAGAVCAFTSEHASGADLRNDEQFPALIAVHDTREALQALGRWYRETKVPIPFVGVTGSVGKTTTREMIACALSAEKQVYATKGNSNSQVGVPITVTETDPEAEIGVIELGMSEFGEMHRIAEVARVNAAVVTNIGISHINQLKTQENILKEKLHILDGTPDGTPLFLNGDDPILRELTEEKVHAYGIAKGRRVPIVFYGTGENADWRAEHIRLSDGLPQFELHFRVNAGDPAVRSFLEEGQASGTDERTAKEARQVRLTHETAAEQEKKLRTEAARTKEQSDRETAEQQDLAVACRLQVAGMHMVLNAAAAVAAAAYFGVEPERAAAALGRFSGVDGRGETFEAGGVRVIDDSYNAAPSSMKAGLSVLCELPAAGRRIAVLADMLELGENEAAYHREVGAFIRTEGLALDEVFLYGPQSRHIAEGILGSGESTDEKSGADASGNCAEPAVSAEAREAKDCGSSAAVCEIAGKPLRLRQFADLDALSDALLQELQSGDSVLVKGSNGMGLRKVVEKLRALSGRPQ